jgi:hypothetical protein
MRDRRITLRLSSRELALWQRGARVLSLALSEIIREATRSYLREFLRDDDWQHVVSLAREAGSPSRARAARSPAARAPGPESPSDRAAAGAASSRTGPR